MPKVVVFVVVLLSSVNSVCVCVLFFLEMVADAAIIKKGVKRPPARHLPCAESAHICAITTTSNERKIPKALNSRRAAE